MLQLGRTEIQRAIPDREWGHRLLDYNDLPTTSVTDIIAPPHWVASALRRDLRERNPAYRVQRVPRGCGRPGRPLRHRFLPARPSGWVHQLVGQCHSPVSATGPRATRCCFRANAPSAKPSPVEVRQYERAVETMQDLLEAHRTDHRHRSANVLEPMVDPSDDAPREGSRTHRGVPPVVAEQVIEPRRDVPL